MAVVAAASAGETRLRIGDHLRQWRQRRRRSQLDLAPDVTLSEIAVGTFFPAEETTAAPR